ncbi:MAG: secretin N-terminal domain-containing protein, partial [Massilia sp.]
MKQRNYPTARQSASYLRLSLCCAALAGCAAPSLPPSPSHLSARTPVAGAIPDPVMPAAPLPPPTPLPKRETYSVTVNKVPVRSLLLALARDAGLDVDIHDGLEGTVTLNALDQTLPQLLARVARQVDLRYEVENGVLSVMPDTPFWRQYKVDYVNMARSTNSSVNIATQISTTGSNSGAGAQTGTPATTVNNNSTSSVVNRSENNFWSSLEKNLRDM